MPYISMDEGPFVRLGSSVHRPSMRCLRQLSHGPIITISLINASPSNPAKGTYYFSVVNGTTEWMNSITPPSQFSTLITKTPEITPIISSVSVAPSSGTSLTFSTVPSTTSQYATPPSIATSSLSTLPSSTLSSPSSGTISSVTITATSIVTGGQTTIITRVTETTIEGAPPRPTSITSLPITSTVITTLISTTPNGSTTTSVVTSPPQILSFRLLQALPHFDEYDFEYSDHDHKHNFECTNHYDDFAFYDDDQCSIVANITFD
ncbi:hypothetical protein SNOG_02654 [Parastagonospora nodorum SN15]|uniref:Uncharacterized protein n=1 Tax=Phaeosphaeria nodorum (strain SN15 / ATCC MYA-4574 / FGSC 10173) TaxID=321614 RepID=Q0V010_PHANO|nr:hypothetical protein SNOG_02654 [Parastagonospora nodorum SN15]EAT89385.1 hypothetical protein SNOG_02654 [Parastagonospora nodorum SN15]